MKTFLVIAMLALSFAAFAPTAEASCAPNPRFVQVCQSSSPDCYDVYVMGENVYRTCIA